MEDRVGRPTEERGGRTSLGGRWEGIFRRR
jgi:hypothetical protein